MKRLGFLLLVLVLGTSISIAQNRGEQRNMNPEDMAKNQTKELKEKLDLDSKQEKKVYELNLKSANKMVAMRDEMRSGNGDRDAMRQKMTELRNEQNKEMKKILSDDQYKKYEKYVEERRNNMRNRGGGGQRR